MTNTSRTGTIQIEFLTDTFPVIGNCAESVKTRLIRERTKSLDDLYDTHVDATVSYDDYFPRPDDINTEPDAWIDLTKLQISRVGEHILIEAKANVLEQNINPDDPYCWMPVCEITVAQSRIPVGKILRIAKAYLDAHSHISTTTSEFSLASTPDTLMDLDKRRTQLHHDLALEIEKSLEKGDINFPSSNTALSEFAPWRYLSTALIMHVMPAQVFEDTYFLKSHVKPKYDARNSRRSDFNFK